MSKYNQAASQDVRALDGDGNRSRNEAPAQVVLGPHHYALAAVHVHGVVGNFAAEFGTVILENGGWDGRFFALNDGASRYGHCGVHDVSVTGDSCQCLAYALEICDRRVELLANGRVRAGRIASCLTTT